MEAKLNEQLLKVISERRFNTLSPRGLLEISIATIEVVQVNLYEGDPLSGHDRDILDETKAILLEHH